MPGFLLMQRPGIVFLAIGAGFLYSLYGADGFLLTRIQCGT